MEGADLLVDGARCAAEGVGSGLEGVDREVESAGKIADDAGRTEEGALRDVNCARRAAGGSSVGLFEVLLITDVGLFFVFIFCVLFLAD